MKRIKMFCCQDPFEPLDDMLYRYYRDELSMLLKKTSNRTADAIIGFLKEVLHGYRWDLFCWTVQNYALLQTDTSRLFKFAWLFSAPDVRAAEMLRYHIAPDSLMDRSESAEIGKLPEKMTVYKAVFSRTMELAEDEEEEEWDPGFDWKWSLDLSKTAYIASVFSDYIVISTVVTKPEVMALFHGVYFSYELIAEANCYMRNKYKIELDNPKDYLIDHPYYHPPITEERIYHPCGF